MPIASISLAVAILLGVAGQAALKTAAARTASLTEQLLSPLTIGGLALYFCSAAAYMAALRGLPLSVAAPSVAVSYVLLVAIGIVMFGESVTPRAALGMAAIVAGVVLLHSG